MTVAAMYGTPVKWHPVLSQPGDKGAYLPGRASTDWAIVHDIEGPASAGIAVFENPAAVVSIQFLADGRNNIMHQMLNEGDTAYAAGNYTVNSRSVQIELPGWVGRAYDQSDLDLCAKFLAWANQTYGIPLVKLSLSEMRAGNVRGVCGHSDVPNPNNPNRGGGRDGHTDPGNTFPWQEVLAKARAYAGGGSTAGNFPARVLGTAVIWPTGFRIGEPFYQHWLTAGGYAGVPSVNAGVALFGYPVSRVYRRDNGLTVQYFERARMEVQPDGTITRGLVGAESMATDSVPVAAQARED